MQKKKRMLLIIPLVLLIVGLVVILGWQHLQKKQIDEKYISKSESGDITRYEWIRQLTEQYGLTEYNEETPYFKDVASDNTYFAAVQSAVEWKVLKTGDELFPIHEEEEQLLRRLTGDTTNVAVSVGVIVGDKIIVKEGPLIGMEGMIKRIDRHKRMAVLEVELFNRVSEVKVGLRCCTTLKQLYSTLPAVRQATNLSVFSRQAPVLGDSNLYLPYSILLILTLKFGIFSEKTMDLDKHLKFFLRKGKKTISSKNKR